MESTKLILYVKCEKCEPVPSPELSSALWRNGYHVTITELSEIESVLARTLPVLAIARLPGHREADIQVCRLLLRTIRVPVIVISSLDDVDCRIASFDAGIEAYLVSPVSPSIVVAWVKTMLRRQAYQMVQP